MRWHMVAIAVGSLSLSLAGCSENISSIAVDDAEREALVQRTLALQARVTAAGRITAEQRGELEAIKREIGGWQERTGRNDLSVSASRPSPSADMGTAALVSKDPTTPSCSPCPPVTFNGTYICFLSEEGPCRPGEFIQKTCVYVCINIGSTPSR